MTLFNMEQQYNEVQMTDMDQIFASLRAQKELTERLMQDLESNNLQRETFRNRLVEIENQFKHLRKSI